MLIWKLYARLPWLILIVSTRQLQDNKTHVNSNKSLSDDVNKLIIEDETVVGFFKRPEYVFNVNDTEFILISILLDHEDAAKYCVKTYHGGRLALIPTEALADSIAEYLSKCNLVVYLSIWIAAKTETNASRTLFWYEGEERLDKLNNEVMRFIDTREINHDDRNSTYTQNGVPLTKEMLKMISIPRVYKIVKPGRCLSFDRIYVNVPRFHPASCGELLPILCERPRTSSNDPNDETGVGLLKQNEYVFNVNDTEFILISTPLLDHEDAAKYCVKTYHGGRLALIPTEALADSIAEYLLKCNLVVYRSIWIAAKTETNASRTLFWYEGEERLDKLNSEVMRFIDTREINHDDRNSTYTQNGVPLTKEMLKMISIPRVYKIVKPGRCLSFDRIYVNVPRFHPASCGELLPILCERPRTSSNDPNDETGVGLLKQNEYVFNVNDTEFILISTPLLDHEDAAKYCVKTYHGGRLALIPTEALADSVAESLSKFNLVLHHSIWIAAKMETNASRSLFWYEGEERLDKLNDEITRFIDTRELNNNDRNATYTQNGVLFTKEILKMISVPYVYKIMKRGRCLSFDRIYVNVPLFRPASCGELLPILCERPRTSSNYHTEQLYTFRSY